MTTTEISARAQSIHARQSSLPLKPSSASVWVMLDKFKCAAEILDMHSAARVLTRKDNLAHRLTTATHAGERSNDIPGGIVHGHLLSEHGRGNGINARSQFLIARVLPGNSPTNGNRTAEGLHWHVRGRNITPCHIQQEAEATKASTLRRPQEEHINCVGTYVHVVSY